MHPESWQSQEKLGISSSNDWCSIQRLFLTLERIPWIVHYWWCRRWLFLCYLMVMPCFFSILLRRCPTGKSPWTHGQLLHIINWSNLKWMDPVITFSESKGNKIEIPNLKLFAPSLHGWVVVKKKNGITLMNGKHSGAISIRFISCILDWLKWFIGLVNN